MILTLISALGFSPWLTPQAELTENAYYVKGSFSKEESWANLKKDSSPISIELLSTPGAATRSLLRAPELELCEGEFATSIQNESLRHTKILETIYIPLDSGTFYKSSNYGWRLHPIFGEYRLHSGTDYAASSGTHVRAVSSGVIVESQFSEGSGNHVVIRHQEQEGSIWYSSYFHLLEIGEPVGKEVHAGDYIGMVGSTGNSTGAHLHLEILDSAKNPIDPDLWLSEKGARFYEESCLP